jgi:hypothetical protein
MDEPGRGIPVAGDAPGLGGFVGGDGVGMREEEEEERVSSRGCDMESRWTSSGEADGEREEEETGE